MQKLLEGVLVSGETALCREKTNENSTEKVVYILRLKADEFILREIWEN